METWTKEHWENLERLSNTLSRLLKENNTTNKAWQAKLKITLKSLAMYIE